MRTPWIFEDEYASTVYELEVNPQEASMPSVVKTYTPSATAAGQQIIFQGRSPSQQLSCSGIILTEDQYNTMREWARLEKQIKITDDLGRVFWVYIKSFAPRRVRSSQYPWTHEFSMTAVVLSWEE